MRILLTVGLLLPLGGEIRAQEGAGTDASEASEQPVRRLWLEAGAGVAMPTQEFGDVDPTCPPNTVSCPLPAQIGAATGVGLSVRAGFRFDDRTTAFIGYARNEFQCSAFLCGGAKPPLATGLEAGVQRTLTRVGAMDFWGELSGSYEQVRIVRLGANGNLRANRRVPFERKLGLTVGTGIRLGVRGNNQWEFIPAARYRFYTAEPLMADADLRAVDVTHFHLELAFRKNFR